MLRNLFRGCVNRQDDLSRSKVPAVVLCVGMIVGALLPLSSREVTADAVVGGEELECRESPRTGE